MLPQLNKSKSKQTSFFLLLSCRPAAMALFFILCCLPVTGSHSPWQRHAGMVSTGTDTLTNGHSDPETHIQQQFEALRKASTDRKKLEIGSSIKSELETLLADPASFFHPFDSLIYIGKVYTPDSTIRIYSFNIPMMDGTHKYYAFIQKYEAGLELFTLKHSGAVLDTAGVYGQSDWYGALYYSVRRDSCASGVFFTVLGLDFNNHLTSRKIIDVFHFNDGMLVFGTPVFPGKVQRHHRMIFEFSSRVSMMLRFDENLNMIVFDHLSPPREELTGQLQFYGPDFSYDGLRLEGCNWVLVEDLDLRMTANE